jgi:hypothetical protein
MFSSLLYHISEMQKKYTIIQFVQGACKSRIAYDPQKHTVFFTTQSSKSWLGTNSTFVAVHLKFSQLPCVLPHQMQETYQLIS